jgi:general secretion pathway protein D
MMQRRTQPYCSPSRRRAFLAFALFGGILPGCVTSNPGGDVQRGEVQRGDVLSAIREVDLTPRFPRQVRSSQAGGEKDKLQGASYYAEGVAAVPGDLKSSKRGNDDALTTGALPDRAQDSGGKGYEMNFENAPVASVAKAVLGDILGVGYTIDARVQGTVNLSSGRPVPRKDLLYALESALRVNNIALLRDGRNYRLVPSPDAVGSGSLDSAQALEAGYGITVVPLQYVSAHILAKLLENFAAKPGMVRADTSRNMMVIQGNAADRQAAINTVLNFDADWMRGQSVGIYPVSNSTPEPIITEVEKIIDSGEGGLSQSLVKLSPVSRQNAILVVSAKPDLLKTVSTWITRLDKSGGAGTGVRVYRMRYGDARQAAVLLNDMFTGNSGGGLDGGSGTSPIAPGSGVVASSSSRLSAAPQQASATSGEQPTAVNFNNRFADASGGGRLGSGSASPATIGGRGGSSPGYPGGGAGGGPVLPNVRIAPDVPNNALMIYANQESYRIVERALEQIDRPQLQVAIDATIAEITLNDKLSYGVQFFLKSQQLGAPSNTGSLLNIPGDTGAVLSRVIPGFNFLLGSAADPRMVLDALHSITDVRVLSTPSLVVLDNQFASLQVGDQVPVSTGQATVLTGNNTVVNTIDYRNTGIILRVAPRINANGNVLLDIEQEISSVAQTATAQSLTPTVSQRKVRSSIAVASGQTVLLGGLMSERQERGRSGIPGLDQIPGVGALFSRTLGISERTELIIFIRPQIIRNGVDAQRIAQDLRSKMRGFSGPMSDSGPAAIARPLKARY